MGPPTIRMTPRAPPGAELSYALMRKTQSLRTAVSFEL
ncbi:hypothetical protein J2X47_000489 [Sphingomonas sp. BE270]|nr:hypothetical protein [Sphingomonas sp. BE270]